MSNDGGAYTIEQFNSEHSTSFTHFVVYTLRNVSLSTYSDCYVSAYLNLSGEGGVNTQTKAIAIKIGDLSEKYIYTPSLGTSFIVGSIGGNDEAKKVALRNILTAFSKS